MIYKIVELPKLMCQNITRLTNSQTSLTIMFENSLIGSAMRWFSHLGRLKDLHLGQYRIFWKKKNFILFITIKKVQLTSVLMAKSD